MFYHSMGPVDDATGGLFHHRPWPTATPNCTSAPLPDPSLGPTLPVVRIPRKQKTAVATARDPHPRRRCFGRPRTGTIPLGALGHELYARGAVRAPEPIDRANAGRRRLGGPRRPAQFAGYKSPPPPHPSPRRPAQFSPRCGRARSAPRMAHRTTAISVNGWRFRLGDDDLQPPDCGRWNNGSKAYSRFSSSLFCADCEGTWILSHRRTHALHI